MTDPSKEQIEAWSVLAGFAGVDEPTARAFHAAYAAGRRAGMEEAAKICDGCADAADDEIGVIAEALAKASDAIRAAMESDHE